METAGNYGERSKMLEKGTGSMFGAERTKGDGTWEVVPKCQQLLAKLCKPCKRLRNGEEKFNKLSEYSSGESDEETYERFALMDDEEKAERVADLWRVMIAKSRGAVFILNKLSDINRHVYLHGSTRKKEDVENQDKL